MTLSVSSPVLNNSAKHHIDTSTRKQKEDQKGAQRASKGGRADKKSTSDSIAPPAAVDAATGADA